MRKLQSIAMLLMAFCLSFSITSCSSDDDNNKTGFSKEDLIGFWEVDADNSQILSAKVNGEDISAEELKEGYGSFLPSGLLFLNEDGTAVFSQKESLWKVNENGFNLYESESEGTNYKVTALSYDKMTIEYQTTTDFYGDEIFTVCRATLNRYSEESSSNDNNLIVGSWKATQNLSWEGSDYTIYYYYDFYANGSYKFRIVMPETDDYIQFGMYTFNNTENKLITDITEIPAVLNGNVLTVTNDNDILEFIKQE